MNNYSIQTSLDTWFEAQGVTGPAITLAATAISVLLLALAAWLAKAVTQHLVLRAVAKAVGHTRVQWDDALQKHGFFSRLAHLAPSLVLQLGAPLFTTEHLAGPISRFGLLYTGVVGLGLADAVLNTGAYLYSSNPANRGKPIKGYVQTAKIFLVVMVGIWGLALILGKSPWGLLSGIGALSAVLMLVFKDSILGLVASTQISAYDMIAVGDWIEMPKYGADGDVLDVGLHTVKVQNWDKTITTIPTHALVADSFKNWRGMSASGGRRIKRSLCIDMNTVTFCNEAMVRRFEKMRLIEDYVREKREEIDRYNREHGMAPSEVTNGRRMTNLGTFRAWIKAFLRENEHIHRDMTFLVRQLAPTDTGLPLEIYVFSNDTNWVNYEGIQADIFDHILAAIHEFDLAIYQAPAGRDVQEGLRRLAKSES